MSTTNTPTMGNEVVIQSIENKKPVKYMAAGQEVTLSRTIVTNYLTKGSTNVSDTDIVQFISICQFNQLNPFLNEAYLVKYGDQPAQMVVSKEAFMKRADACPNYDGIQAGIIVLRNNIVTELEGCFMMQDDVLVGGWAKVFRDDRKYPVVAKVSFAEYNKGKSLWKEKPATMICKVAKVQALREAFPSQLGAMYTREESQLPDDQTPIINEVNKEKAEHANKSLIGSGLAPESKPLPEAQSPVSHQPNQPSDAFPGF